MQPMSLDEAITRDLDTLTRVLDISDGSDQQEIEHLRFSGILLPTLHAWFEGDSENGTITIYNKDETDRLDPGDGNKFADLFLRSPGFKSIVAFSKDRFIPVSPDTWALFRTTDTKGNVEKLLKKLFPLTTLKPIGIDLANDDPLAAVASMPMVAVFLKFVQVMRWIPFVSVVQPVVEKNLENVDWAASCCEFLLALAIPDGGNTNWLAYTFANMLAKCTTKAERLVFKGVLGKLGTFPMLVDALLRSGSGSEDHALDVLDLLEIMDPATVASFLYTDARVVHRNYFLRLFTHRALQESASPRRQKSAPRPKAAVVDKGAIERIKATQDWAKSIDEGEYPAATNAPAISQSQLTAKALVYLGKSNPWALDRQFVSWRKRISESILDAERLEMIKSAISRMTELARRSMAHSPEIAGYCAKKWRETSFLEKCGIEIQSYEIGALPADVLGEELVSAFQIMFSIEVPSDVAAGKFVHLLTAPQGTLPQFLPGTFEDDPWIMLSGGNVVGLGISGLRLKELPSFVLNLKDLIYLDASNNLIKKIKDLAPLEAVRFIDLSRNNLYKIKTTGNHQHVMYLDLHSNFLTNVDIDPFSSDLKVLDVSRNQFRNVADVQGLESCRNLGSLNLAWNRLANLSGFPGLPRLVMLFTNGNEIVKLGLDNEIPSLRRLVLSDNNLGALKGIELVSRVFFLDASRNYLKNIKDVIALDALKILNVAANQLDNVDDIFQMEKLEIVDLRSNPLPSLDDEQKEQFLFSEHVLLPAERILQ
jgi:hypothetical protein